MKLPAVSAFLLALGSPMAAQVLTVGFNSPYCGGSINPSVTQTTLQTVVAAPLAGSVTTP